ncbi:YihY/virulence factor BrkB family protein [Arthrobacter sp. UM1]|uniref:YihY/virulence factor BrkB family protein n=1 Tax=Arthrobacter sp. UM1 TaxID=2766776 RepID=UPI001CF69E46|nr:YihY/virulence factor BrkB family protein [Arthrobacter sp. UM1]MCB4207921.1 YihY/virulence factor BrkB family protein [Arthrobacter sp. UM1]
MARTRRLNNTRKSFPQQEKADPNTPSPLDPAELRVSVLEKKQDIAKAERDGTSTTGPKIGLFMARLSAFKPMRAFTLYSKRHGPIMAAGAAYNMFFSVAALLVAGFSIFGLVAAGNEGLKQTVIESVAKSTPGLIDTGSGGLAKPDKLFSQSSGFGIALVISTATMLFTALGWINGLREAMRGVYGLDMLQQSFPVKKLRDLGTLLLLGVALILTSLVGAVFTSGTKSLMDFMHLQSGFAQAVVWIVGFLVTLVLDMLVAVILFRLASGIHMPKKAMWVAAFIAGFGSAVLRLFSAQLLGGASKNPLLAPFAVILGLFVWFYFLSQVYLIATAAGRVVAADEELREESHLTPHKPGLLRRSTARRLEDSVAGRPGPRRGESGMAARSAKGPRHG